MHGGRTACCSTQHEMPSAVSQRIGSIGVMCALSGPVVGDDCSSVTPASSARRRHSLLASLRVPKTETTVAVLMSRYRRM